MTKTHDISFIRLQKSDYALVRHIEVAPEQIVYCGTVDMAFASDEAGLDFYAVSVSGDAVGFFKIDHKYPQTYAFARDGDLGLRAFMINRDRQNMGIGTAALRALPALLRDNYPAAMALILTVNIRNQAAIRSYLTAGFARTGELFDSGIGGPQLVMRRPL